MHNFVKTVLILPLVLLCACSNGIDIKCDKSDYATNKSDAKISLPKLKYAQNQAFADSVASELENEAKLILDDFFEKELPKLEADTKIVRNNGRIVSLIFEGEAETQNAHGEKFRRSKTYDFLLGKKLSLTELFEGDAWKQMADNKMKALSEKGEGEYEDLWEVATIELLNEENFYLKEGALVIYYPPYQLSYYRRGYVEFEFKKEEISGFLSDYGREIL